MSLFSYIKKKKEQPNTIFSIKINVLKVIKTYNIGRIRKGHIKENILMKNEYHIMKNGYLKIKKGEGCR